MIKLWLNYLGKTQWLNIMIETWLNTMAKFKLNLVTKHDDET